jgi:para-nitrobenzyl esterase
MRIFLGVPYAAPPVGPNRFRPPRPAAHFDAPFDARIYGPPCPQLARLSGLGPAKPDAAVEGQEDCLNLNVWTPADARIRPVMVFIHGGGFQQGSNRKPFYEGSQLSRAADIVLVTINYRIGVLGLLALEPLVKESDDGSVGNYAIRDQIAALRWVRDNIAAFGGDPSNVTIFGESAGALSVCALVASPLTPGLFRRAIMESGGGCLSLPRLTDSGRRGELGGYARGAEIAAAAGCGDAEDVLRCLRAKDAATLVRAGTHHRETGAIPKPMYSPVLDGVTLTGSALERLRRGEVGVPLVIGSNADEATLFMRVIHVKDPAEYEEVMRSTFGERTDQVLKVYPVPASRDVREAVERVITETGFICPALELAAAASERLAVYSYYFTYHRKGPIASRLGAFHGIEILYLFWSVPFEGNDDDREVTRVMRAAWGGFAHAGVPRADPPWPAYTRTEPFIYQIDVHPRVVVDVTEGRCARFQTALGGESP